MKLTFEEACRAVADLFEAIPETWCHSPQGRRSSNNYNDCCAPDDPFAIQWCAIGGVRVAMGMPESVLVYTQLEPAAKAVGYRIAAEANHAGRLVAIRMLRIASGEIKP